MSHGRGFVSLSDCYLSSAGRAKNPGMARIEADGGKLRLRGCSFATDEPALALKKGLAHAIIREHNGARGLEIVNETGQCAIMANSEPAK